MHINSVVFSRKAHPKGREEGSYICDKEDYQKAKGYGAVVGQLFCTDSVVGLRRRKS